MAGAPAGGVPHLLEVTGGAAGRGDEFRYRAEPLELADATEVRDAARLDGDYLSIDLGQIATRLDATALRGDTAAEAARGPRTTPAGIAHGRHRRARDPHADLPGAGVWWDVAPAEVSEVDHRAAAALRVRARPRHPAVARMTAPLQSPLDNGALARTVRAGELTLGTFLGTASALTAEVCAAAGFDWVLLDLEHGAGGEEQVRDVVPAAGSYGVPTVVRVETDARIRMGRVLDSGAAGIMLPRMDSAAQVGAALTHLGTRPGDRGVATYNRAAGSGSTRAA